MEIKVKSRNLKISPRKVRPVLHGYRGMTAQMAKNTARFTNKKAAGFLYNLIKSGIAAAKENYLEADQVTIKEIFCGEGPRLKRIQPWSKGQARRITKRLAHITLVLESVEQAQKADNNEDKNQVKEDKENV